MYILCKKKRFWSVGIHFKGSSWQLKCFCYQILLNQTCRPPWQLAQNCELRWSEVLHNYFPACVCVLNICRCVCVCVWARETSAIVGLLHPDNWEPDGLKITQRFPFLPSFGAASPVCFDFFFFTCVPPECSGSPTATSCHMVPHCSPPNCA